MELLLFLIQVVVISLSGVMAPGPVTAAAIGMGARSRFAGPLIAIGHGVVEFPLMVLLVLGIDKILKSTATQIAIGLAGGTFLLIMAIQMLRSMRDTKNPKANTGSHRQKIAGGGPVTTSGPGPRTRPVVAGIVLSGGNPYFLLWWATVGLTLAMTAKGLGIWAFALFAIVHWLCDLVWLSALSWASFKGSALLGSRIQQIVLLICALALLSFGLFFIYKAGIRLIEDLFYAVLGQCTSL